MRRRKPLQRLFLGHADHRIVVAGHADIAHERGAARQDAQIRGRRMRMRADDNAGAAVAEIAHRLLLAGGLARACRRGWRRRRERNAQARQFAVDRGERIVQRIHEDAAHGVDDQHAPAVLGLDQRGAAARRAGRIVDRPDQPRRAFDEDQRFLLIPGMIAERDRVGAGLDEFVVDRLGDAEAAGRVLAIDDDAIELPVADQAGQALGDDRAAAAADNVADKENAHQAGPLIAGIRERVRARSVSS